MASRRELKTLITLAGRLDPSLEQAMLKAAGTSVAMGNAIHGIQAFCDFTTTDIHQDGLANAFKTLGLV